MNKIYKHSRYLFEYLFNCFQKKNQQITNGFTIVELLVVIVIIGILATVTIVSYSGITSRATIASLQSDLSNNSRKLSLYYTEHGFYPTALDPTTHCPTAPVPDSAYCLISNSDTVLSYQPSSSTNAKEFTLYANSDSTFLRLSSDSGISTNPLTLACPHGFIVVPGSSTYGTSDFCVMKYEAKADDNGDGIGDSNQNTGTGNTWPANTYPISDTRKLVSTPQGYPVAAILQPTSIIAASSYTSGCDTGCHLVTEAEWMTIAQNVLSVPSNWSGGSVGSGFIYRGNSDAVPTAALEADTSDTNGYAGTENSSPSNQRRTLNLTNGEVIWDLAGNVGEYTQGFIAGGQQPGLVGDSDYVAKDWNNGSLLMNGLPYLSQPSSTAIAGISGWSSSQGIGRLYSYYSEAADRIFLRGGRWSDQSLCGVLALDLYRSPSYTTGSSIGFRVSR